MIIETRVNLGNKGAELMLHAILEKMKGFFPDAEFAMLPQSGSYYRRAELGLLQKAWYPRYGFQWGEAASLATEKIRRMYGIVLEREIDIVLDASGFGYTDVWGAGPTIELANSCKRWKKNNTKLVLLPQAFGPFTSKAIKDAIKTVADSADLIFARDAISYGYLTEVVGERANIKIAADFTNLIKGVLPGDFDAKKNRFCIIPNHQMVSRAPKKQSEAYLPFMIKCVQHLLSKGIKPFFLIHEGPKDFILARDIADAVGGGFSIIREEHPLKIKGILGACECVISSRFHGLVSSLSQGVPALGTAWSHKYKILFEDYGFDDGIMDLLAGDKEIGEKIDLIIEPESRQRIIKTIREKSEALKQLTDKMWEKVFVIVEKKQADGKRNRK